jgi:hypothetical protein
MKSENRVTCEIFNHREHKDHKALTDYGKPGRPRNHFATSAAAAEAMARQEEHKN